MKKVLFLVAFLMPLCVSMAKTTYTYKLVRTSVVPYNDEQHVYPNANNYYTFKIELSPVPREFAKGSFKVKLENAKFSDGNVSNDVYENSEFSIIYDDIPNQYGIVKIETVTAINSDIDTLVAGSPTQISYAIASLKGQTPNVTLSNSNPQMGNTQAITAQLWSDMVYPGIYVSNRFGGVTDLKVEDYEWTLPSGWRTSNGKTGTFYLGATESKNGISIIPDNFTSGELKVRAMNSLPLASSEYKTFTMDRGFAFTAYPSSITFGDKTTRTFSLTAFSGIIYEWSVPAGWQINGQGTTLEGINLNSVSIMPDFCTIPNDKVKVRLKKDNEVSPWLEFSTQITTPDILSNTSTIYQYEEAVYTLKYINLNEIQSVNFSGNGVSYIANQSGGYRIRFSTAGNIEVNVSVLLNGCTTPITFNKQITVKPHRISISVPSLICTTGTCTINNLPLGSTVTWYCDYRLNLISGQGSSTATFSTTSNGKFSISAMIAVGGNSFTLSQTVNAGIPDRPWIKNGTTIDKGSSATYTMCLGQGTKSLYLTLLNPDNSVGISSWEVTKTLNPNNFSLILSGNNLYVNPLQIGGGRFTVKSHNSCGASAEMTVYLTINTCSGGRFPIDLPSLPVDFASIYPNPAIDILTVELKEDETESTVTNLSVSAGKKAESYTVQLWSEQQILVRTIETAAPKQQISLQGLPEGMYFAVLLKNKKTIYKQIFWIKR